MKSLYKNHSVYFFKNKKSNEYFDFIKQDDISEIKNNREFIESQKQFALNRKINFIDNHSNYFYLENLETFKYKNTVL